MYLRLAGICQQNCFLSEPVIWIQTQGGGGEEGISKRTARCIAFLPVSHPLLPLAPNTLVTKYLIVSVALFYNNAIFENLIFFPNIPNSYQLKPSSIFWTQGELCKLILHDRATKYHQNSSFRVGGGGGRGDWKWVGRRESCIHFMS